MSAKDQGQRKQISSGSLSPVLSEIQKITAFKDGMPDYIDKMLMEKVPSSTQAYDQEDGVSLLAPADMELDPPRYSMYLPYSYKIVQGLLITQLKLLGT